MTHDYIESSCGLYNGVRFEELQVAIFNEDKIPKIYTVILSFEGHLDESKTNNLNRIPFNSSSGKYSWSTDTATNGLYRQSGTHREQISKMKETLPDTTISTHIIIAKDSFVGIAGQPNTFLEKDRSSRQMTLPIKFKPETWYYLNFYDQRYEAYLYIDKDMNYKINKISLPTNY